MWSSLWKAFSCPLFALCRLPSVWYFWAHQSIPSFSECSQFLIWPLWKFLLSLRFYFFLMVVSWACTGISLGFIFKITVQSYKIKIWCVRYYVIRRLRNVTRMNVLGTSYFICQEITRELVLPVHQTACKSVLPLLLSLSEWEIMYENISN